MELRSLRYFLTVAETLSISSAAIALNITQPTLSRQLKQLELELGAELFKRESSGIVLTEEGMFLKNRAAEILTLTNHTQQAFADKLDDELRGHISIGCVEADNSDTLAMILEELVTDYPSITFNLYSGTSDDIIEKLDKGLIDIAILLEPITLKNYEKIALPRTEQWGLLVSDDSPLYDYHMIKPNRLSQASLLMSARIEVQQMIAKWCGIHVDELNFRGTYNLIFNILDLVKENVGSALLIEGAISNIKLDNQLKFIPLEPSIKTNCILTWKKSRVLTPVLELFINKFKELT